MLTRNHNAFEHAKPVKATKMLPDWWKPLPKSVFLPERLVRVSTIKACPGIIDLYRSGLILNLWSDVNIRIDPDGAWKYQFADGVSELKSHPSWQIKGSRFADGYTQMKFVSPWLIKGPKTAEMLLVPTFWNDSVVEDMHVAHGVVSLQSPIDMNCNVFFKRREESVTYELEFGQPLVHWIPLTEKNVEYKYELVSDAEYKKHWQGDLTLFFTNRLRRAKKLCPHAE